MAHATTIGRSDRKLTTPAQPAAAVQPAEATGGHSGNGPLSHPLRTVADIENVTSIRQNGGKSTAAAPAAAVVQPAKAVRRVVRLLAGVEVESLGRGALGALIAALGVLRAAVDALEARAAAAVDGLRDGGVGATETIRRTTNSSTREARRRARRGTGLAAMPMVADALASGRITGEHADALARAAEATSPEAVEGDGTLLAQIVGRPADLAARDIEDWTHRQQSESDRSDEHARQRRRRRLRIFNGDDNMVVAHALFDRVLGGQFAAVINNIAEQLRSADAKRLKRRPQEAVRTPEQRQLDALAIAVGLEPAPHHMESADGAEASSEQPPDDHTHHSPRRTDTTHNQAACHHRDTDGHDRSGNRPDCASPRPDTADIVERAAERRRHTASDDRTGDRPDRAPPSPHAPDDTVERAAERRRHSAGHDRMADRPDPEPKRPGTTDDAVERAAERRRRRDRNRGRDDDVWRRGGHRNQIVIFAEAGLVTGADPDGRCEIPGVGPLPQSELERLACDSELFGVLFSGDGLPLFHSRVKRTVSDQQWRALLQRDRGCVLCAASPAWCHAHHIVPWAAPAKGATDIDNLALLCTHHHRTLHQQKHTLTQELDGTWITQPTASRSPPTTQAA